MTNEIIETVKSCLTLLIAILCLIFSKSRFKENKRYAVKYENSSILLILRLILTYLLKIISIIILIGICTNKLDVFIAFYVFTPMLICLQLIFFYTNDTKAMFATVYKGNIIKKLNNGLPILHKVPPKRDYGRYFCIMAEKGGTSHGGLTEKLSPFFHAKKQEVNAYGR